MPVGLPPIDTSVGFRPVLQMAGAHGGPYDPAGWWGLPSRLRRVLHGRGFVIGAAQSRPGFGGPNIGPWGNVLDAELRQLIRFRRILLARGFLIGVAQSRALRETGLGEPGSGAWERVLDAAIGAAQSRAQRGTDLGGPDSEAWQRVLDVESGQHWWWLPGTSRSFWEGDPAWQKFRDPETGQRWWFHAESDTWFWVVGYSGLPPSHVGMPGGASSSSGQ